jgi:hypothetical protein
MICYRVSYVVVSARTGGGYGDINYFQIKKTLIYNLKPGSFYGAKCPTVENCPNDLPNTVDHGEESTLDFNQGRSVNSE